ncbi:MAG: UDP-3-O-(3-hydroxymyristoyl)glucosamine N-acyltransferase [Bacteroidota bacterium]
MQISVDELATLVKGTVEGNGAIMIDRPAKIEEAGPGSISFLGNMKYEHFVYTSSASALLVPTDFEPRRPYQSTLIRVDEVYSAVSLLLAAFNQDANGNIQRKISAHAQVDEKAQLGAEVRIGKFSVVESEAVIGAGTVILDQVYIASRVQIGKNCLIYPGVRIMRDSIIGDDCVIHPNTVIGSDGFGFAPQADNTYEKVPQVGNVILEDKVEIGANCTIDRATMGSTIIRQGAKLDNLIQVGHNVEIGENTVIAAQAGIAGSVKIGANCKIGGQTGFAGHISIADHTSFQAQSGVMKRVTEPGGTFFGSPAIPYNNYMRSTVVFRQLPELARTVADLQKRLKNLEETTD